MKLNKKIFMIVNLIIIQILAFHSIVFAADVHSIANYCVDNKEIRWDGYNWYANNRTAGISIWNALSPIDILPDTVWSICDLTFSDRNDSNVSWTGLYSNYGVIGANININNYYLDGYSDAQRTNVFAHELGHALGIGDHTSSSSYMMYDTVTSLTSLNAHDISDYRALWGY
jgi:hypothetical protein